MAIALARHKRKRRASDFLCKHIIDHAANALLMVNFGKKSEVTLRRRDIEWTARGVWRALTYGDPDRLFASFRSGVSQVLN